VELPARRLFLAICAAACVAACATPWRFRIDEIRPTLVSSIFPGPALQAGPYCLERLKYPPLKYTGTADQAMVGYENYHDPGTNPFPCPVFRATVIRGTAQFDLAAYDSVLSAILLFDNLHSVDDTGGGPVIGQSPGQSYATRIGMADDASHRWTFTDEVSLGWKTRPVEVNVTPHVGKWLSGTPNLGFVLANDLDVPPNDVHRLPTNNDAQITWYGNFRLRLFYNIPDNPRTSQN
jgi:hypothetical protein